MTLMNGTMIIIVFIAFVVLAIVFVIVSISPNHYKCDQCHYQTTDPHAALGHMAVKHTMTTKDGKKPFE